MSWTRTITLLATAVVFSLASPIRASARVVGRPGDLTQAEYLQWLAKASGKKATIAANATTADLVKWAVARGIMPEGGWKPEAPLTREAYAQTLAQVYGVPAANDPVRALQREGVMVPNTRLISRETVLTELGDFGFHSMTARESRHPATPINPDPKGFICHKGQSLFLPRSAWPGHLGHGDYLGACQSNDHFGGDKDHKKGGDH